MTMEAPRTSSKIGEYVPWTTLSHSITTWERSSDGLFLPWKSDGASRYALMRRLDNSILRFAWMRY